MRVLQNIVYTTILGYPLIFYLGILTYVLLLVTLIIPVLNTRVKRLPRLSGCGCTDDSVTSPLPWEPFTSFSPSRPISDQGKKATICHQAAANLCWVPAANLSEEASTPDGVQTQPTPPTRPVDRSTRPAS